MPAELSDDEIKEFHAVAERAAAKASRDPEVIGEAANFAVAELASRLDNVSPETPERKGWVAVVARNHALRLGQKLHRELGMGRAGSLPPPTPDEKEAERIEFLIGEMRSGGGQSLGSFVADKVDFENAWALISEQDRLLLDLKYAEGLSSKEIAEKLGKKRGTIDNQLTAAKKAAVLLFADLLGDFDQPEFDHE